MKVGIISDVHGRDLKAIESEFGARKIDEGICLGDFDRAHIARQMMEMQKNESPCPWYVVPGNHDHSHVNKVEITSGTMADQDIDSRMMWAEWDMVENSDVRGYVEKLLSGSLRIDMEIGGQKAIIIHGALTGDYQCEPDDLWTRLDTESDHRSNFAEMEKGGYQIMIRGHDHSPVYTYKDPKKGVFSYRKPGVDPKWGGDGEQFRLFKHMLHTINPGAHFNGNFAVIDTDVSGEDCPLLTYCKL